MAETVPFLVERLKTEGAKIRAFFGSLSEEQWTTEVYTEGTTWTVRNVLAHLLTAERAFVKLFEQIRQGGPGASPDFSIDRYNASQQERAKGQSPAELLEQFELIRQEMGTWVSGLQEADLARVGRHPFLGETTLLEMIKMVYLHNQIHLRDVRKSLGPQ